MRHYDLDQITQLDALIESLKKAFERDAFSAIANGADIRISDEKAPVIAHGQQYTVHRTIECEAQSDRSAIGVKAVFSRYISPPQATVNNTCQLFVEPISRMVMQARILLVTIPPIIGLLIGLLGWRILQYDTGMTPPSWVIAGTIVGELLGLALMPFWAHRLGALLEGRNSFNNPRQVGKVLTTVEAIMQREIEQAQSREAERKADAKPVESAPSALAAFADALVSDPDQAIIQFGLVDETNRQAIIDSFMQLKKDLALFTQYKQTRRIPQQT